MNTTSTHFVPPRGVGMWGETFKGLGDPNTSPPMIMEVNTKVDTQSEDTFHATRRTSNNYDKEATMARPIDKLCFSSESSRSEGQILGDIDSVDSIIKWQINPFQVQRRLAQNREAAQKSRLRKKAYVQQLETSRQKLIHLEQELERARQQGFYVGSGVDTCSLETLNSGIAAFNTKYAHWVDKQNGQICELRNALKTHISDVELRILVEAGISHYFELFRMKFEAAKADVFYVMSGMWKTSAERFFLWIGGFRPSELLKVLLPQFDPLTDQQLLDAYHLTRSCQQTEDALSQGMDKLQQTLAESVAAGRLGGGNYIPQMSSAIERLEGLVSFVNQADHLRQETLQQTYQILTTRQAARGLLALGEYFLRLRALSSVYSSVTPESKLPT